MEVFGGSVRGAALHCSARVLVFVVLSMCRIRQSQALVRPGECIVNGDCQSDPEQLHGAQDWEGYATHASGHSPSRFGRSPACGCDARVCSMRGTRNAPSVRAGGSACPDLWPCGCVDATPGPPTFIGPAVTIRVRARTRCANAALAVRLFARARVGLRIAARCAWRTTISEC
jgi:hypothetical protein